MKKLTIIIILLVFQISFGQGSNTLIGHWYNTWKTPKTEKGIYYKKDTIILKRSNKFGRNLYFNQDGTFTDRYVAPCGNDGGIHEYNGKWKLVDKDLIEIYELKEKYNKANIYPAKKGHTMVVLEKGLFKIEVENKFLLKLQIVKNYESYTKKE